MTEFQSELEKLQKKNYTERSERGLQTNDKPDRGIRAGKGRNKTTLPAYRARTRLPAVFCKEEPPPFHTIFGELFTCQENECTATVVQLHALVYMEPTEFTHTEIL